MSTLRLRTVATLGLAAAAMAVTPAVASSAATAPTRAAVSVRAGKAGVVSLSRQTIRPGRVHLRNTGKHAVAIFEPRHSATVSTLIADVKAANSDTGPATGALFRDFAIDDVVDAHSDVYLRARRTFYVVDANLDNYTTKQVATVRVAGGSANAAAPRSTAVSITTTGVLTRIGHAVARDSYLHVTNHSAHLQVVTLIAVKDSVSAGALKRVLAKPTGQGVSAVMDLNQEPRSIAALSANRSVWVHYRVAAGRYLLWTVSVDDLQNKLTQLHRGQLRLLVAS